jgi:ATP-dependent Lhr-like helicase
LVRLKPDTTTPAVRGVRLQPDLTDREQAILEVLRSRGASFFGPLHEAVGGGYPAETVSALWALAWQGLITNDTFQVVRAFTQSTPPSRRNRRRIEASPFRSRRLVPASAEGRWALVPAADRPIGKGRDARARTTWATALVHQLPARYGVLTRESVMSESIPGGFGTCYPVLKAMEEAGRLRRGYFITGLGATQFALPGALDLLRSLKDGSETPEVVVMSATDPANPYGAALKWATAQGRGPTRTVGATVVLVDGALVAYLAKGDRQLLTWLPEAEPQRSHAATAIASAPGRVYDLTVLGDLHGCYSCLKAALLQADFFAKLDARDTSFYMMSWNCLTADMQEVFNSLLHTPDAARGYGLFQRHLAQLKHFHRLPLTRRQLAHGLAQRFRIAIGAI